MDLRAVVSICVGNTFFLRPCICVVMVTLAKLLVNISQKKKTLIFCQFV